MIKQWSVRAGLCVVTGALMLIGCQRVNPIVGKWQMTQGMLGVSVTFTREFKADGTETMSGGNPGAMNSIMTYTVNGNQLTEAVSSMTINGMTVKIDPSHLPAGVPKGMTETFTIDQDKLTITNSINGIETSQTYDRVTTQ